ncbi:MAG TPA: MutS2/Smr-associated SH3 domain-containing protein, partial [Dehalococcoidia bacterium]|nr:MutS2/Smr-associated SH3 domain-containing protein [Dehalococcoidia bacterium]
MNTHHWSRTTESQALTTLEFDKILARLAGYTAFSAGREAALALQPTDDLAVAARRQATLAEARHLRRTRPHLGLSGANDVRPLAAKAALSGVLDPHELLDIQATLTTVQRLRGNLTRLAQQYPLLAELAKSMFDLSPLVVEISRCIDAQAEVADSASPALAALRREGRIVHDRLQHRIQEILNSALGRGVAQEALITERNGRYVIPIKADFRGQLRGIVHDVSGSGATLWIEPLAVVDLGNQYRELQLDERREVERILRALSAQVGREADRIVQSVELLAKLDVHFAAVRLGEELHCDDLPPDDPEQPWLVPSPAELRLDRARHPLLTGEVVPTTLNVGDEVRVLLITGPNTGGKTVALKTAGLLTLMALAGLPVPAGEATQVPVYDAVFADIGDEQSIEQSLSTFSSHMRNIIGILEHAGPSSLVLLDELGAGTDPEEGAALARAIVQYLLARGCTVIATTHHGELKVFAHETAGVTNAHVEFDTETLSPTYRLRIGLPGRSNAIAIAERLGMPQEVLQLARSAVAPGQGQVDQLLSDLQRERDELAAAVEAEQGKLAEIEETRRRLADELAELEQGREELLRQAREELETELSEVRAALREASRRAERAVKAELPTAQEAVAAAEAQIKQLRRRTPRRPADQAAILPEQTRPGDRVVIRGIDRPGDVVSAPDERGEVDVQLGSLRMRVKLDQITHVARPAAAPVSPHETRVTLPPRQASPGMELE